MSLPKSAALAIAAFCLACGILSSCVGVKAEAKVEADGSGLLDLSLAVSRMASPIASLEADERVLPFPLAREDFEREISRVGGLSLASYSREDGDEEISIKAKIAFDRLAALASFLDPAGKRAIYLETEGRRNLRLVLAPGEKPIDPDLAKLADVAFSSYRVDLALVLPQGAVGATLSPGESAGSSSVKGSRAEYSNDAAALITSAQPVEWEIVW